MFKFGKQKTDKLKSKEAKQSKSDLDDLIHVMPSRFYIQPKKSRLGLILVILISFLIIIVLSIIGYYLNENLKQKRMTDLNVNTNQNNNGNGNDQVNSNQNVNENVNVNLNINDNTNTNINQSTSTDDIVPTPNEETNRPSNPIGPVDSDNDGLTNLEESLFGTNPLDGDTDGDSYQDVAEMLNGYDPTSPVLTLAASGLFSSYNHSNYSIIYPRKWTLREQDEENTEVLFISDVGEFIEVLVIFNVNNLSIENWFAQVLPNIQISPNDYVNVNNAVGVRLEDGKTYYLFDSSDSSRIFVLTYNNGSSNIYNFNTTFNIMANSFKIIK